MSSSTLSLTKAKEIAINFVKKHKDALRNGANGLPVNDSDIAKYEKMTPFDFFNEVTVQANFGSYFNLFDVRWTTNGKLPQIWMGEHSTINDLNKKIAKNSGSDESLRHFYQMDGTWYNLTEARLEALGKILDQLCAKPTVKTAKKSSKKPVKKPEVVVTISDATEVQNEIAFVNFDAKKFEHALQQGGTNFDPMVSNERDNSASNQIDHAINAFKLAKKELDTFISELVKAKEAGAKYVVDTDWCERKDFNFKK